MYVVLNVTLRTTDGTYNEGLRIEAPLPKDIEVELKNHPEWFSVTGSISEEELPKEEEDIPVVAVPKTSTAKTKTLSKKK